MKQSESKRSIRRVLITSGVIVATLGLLLAGMIGCKKKTDPSETTGQSGIDGIVAAEGEYFSPSGVALSEDGSFLYVAGTTDEAIYKYSAADNKLLATYDAGTQVNNVAVNGDKVYAMVGALGGKLVVLDADLKEQGSVVIGHTPMDVVFDGETAYVANRFSCSVSVVDLSSMKETKEIAVSREPEALTLANGKVYVACHLPEDVAIEDMVSARVSVIDTATKEAADSIVLGNGAGSVKDIVASPDGATLYVSHIVARYQYPTTQLDGGWINTNAVSVIGTSDNKVKYTFLLDELELGAGNPWGMALNENGSKLYVALSGTGELMQVDLTKLNKLVRNVEKDQGSVDSVDQIVNYIPFAANCKTRVTLGGEGVRALAYKNGAIYAAQYFSGDVVKVDEASFTVASTYKPGEQPEANAIRLGEALWYDATICYQMWQSCASCHPDGRADGFNWDNLNDGLGVSKQAKSMLYAMRTPPAMVTGIRVDAEIGVAAGLKYICFNANTDGIVQNIEAYMLAMAPEQSPYLNDDGTLTESATRGKALFEEYGCVTCHPAPLYTDMQFHTSVDLDDEPAWEYRDMDTASLVEIWRTYPWGYFGGHTDMVEYVKHSVSKSGKTISDADAQDLANYILSIGAEGEQYGAAQIRNADGTYNKLVAGQNIVSVSVIKQDADAPDAKVTLTLYDQNDKSLESKSEDLKGLTFGIPKTLEMGVTVPSSLGKGAYYVISFEDGSGNKLATDLKIILY